VTTRPFVISVSKPIADVLPGKANGHFMLNCPTFVGSPVFLRVLCG
jgi:hypothetical protein